MQGEPDGGYIQDRTAIQVAIDTLPTSHSKSPPLQVQCINTEESVFSHNRRCNLLCQIMHLMWMPRCDTHLLQHVCCPVNAPESSRLGYGITKEHHIGFQYATTAGAGWEVEVLASTLQLHITIWPPNWNVDFAVWLHDHIALLCNTHGSFDILTRAFGHTKGILKRQGHVHTRMRALTLYTH